MTEEHIILALLFMTSFGIGFAAATWRRDKLWEERVEKVRSSAYSMGVDSCRKKIENLEVRLRRTKKALVSMRAIISNLFPSYRRTGSYAKSLHEMHSSSTQELARLVQSLNIALYDSGDSEAPIEFTGEV